MFLNPPISIALPPGKSVKQPMRLFNISRCVTNGLFLFNRLGYLPDYFQEIFIFNYLSVIFSGNLRESLFDFSIFLRRFWLLGFLAIYHMGIQFPFI
jgi:hypothetical protein